ncbi:MAG: hypothetical protein PHE58_05055 [Candidatus Omnitrophica bacterium]|nr:hypothetical protein [Candidatus Omnitrophota bacterium]
MNKIRKEQYTSTYEIKNIIDTKTVILKDDTTIFLIGIKSDLSKENLSFMKELLSNSKIVLIQDQNFPLKNYFYVYIVNLDIKKIPFKLNNFYPEARGFLDLKVGKDLKKALLYNLNTILLKSGYSEVDTSISFQNLEYFKQCEKEAKEYTRGMWKSR